MTQSCSLICNIAHNDKSLFSTHHIMVMWPNPMFNKYTFQICYVIFSSTFYVCLFFSFRLLLCTSCKGSIFKIRWRLYCKATDALLLKSALRPTLNCALFTGYYVAPGYNWSGWKCAQRNHQLHLSLSSAVGCRVSFCTITIYG